ncbi:hypothetical protein DFH07DRAFT_535148 [Mycena maculata]|nr:hypothetical protein DFH07DRAFT_535148 [Mycena maculata]
MTDSVSHEKTDLFRPWDTLPFRAYGPRLSIASHLRAPVQGYLTAWDCLPPRACLCTCRHSSWLLRYCAVLCPLFLTLCSLSPRIQRITFTAIFCWPLQARQILCLFRSQVAFIKMDARAMSSHPKVELCCSTLRLGKQSFTGLRVPAPHVPQYAESASNAVCGAGHMHILALHPPCSAPRHQHLSKPVLCVKLSSPHSEIDQGCARLWCALSSHRTSASFRSISPICEFSQKCFDWDPLLL